MNKKNGRIIRELLEIFIAVCALTSYIILFGLFATNRIGTIGEQLAASGRQLVCVENEMFHVDNANFNALKLEVALRGYHMVTLDCESVISGELSDCVVTTSHCLRWEIRDK